MKLTAGELDETLTDGGRTRRQLNSPKGRKCQGGETFRQRAKGNRKAGRVGKVARQN
jgi:hypothetical protein